MVSNKGLQKQPLRYIKIFFLVFFLSTAVTAQFTYAEDTNSSNTTIAPVENSDSSTTTSTTGGSGGSVSLDSTTTTTTTGSTTTNNDSVGTGSTLSVTNVPDVGTMLMNFASSIPNLMQLITAVAYVMGLYFVFKGVIGLREFGESRTMMSSSHSLKGPLIFIAVGTALLYLPSSVSTGLNTFWSAPNPYGYVQETTDQWSSLYQDCFLIIQLIGTIAFIRGLVILTQLGGQGGQPGTFGRGITHIIAGTLCINLYDFLNAVYTTLGLASG